VSHLGRRLSALVDGELGDAERDQVHAHLVSCDECREEAVALRTLKRRVSGLGDTPADQDALTSRLIALGGLPEPVPQRPHGAVRARAPFAVAGGLTAADASPLAAPPLGGQATADRGRGHTRFVVVGAVAALAVGLGAASFAAGGGEHLQAPTVTPQVDVFMLEHAVTSGGPDILRPPAPVRP
jgi:anti-sigma factor RsiW